MEIFVGLFLTLSKIKRNKRVGVRIKYSYSSEKAWRYANHLVGRVFLVIGICEILIIYPIYTFLLNSNFVTVTLSVCLSQALVLVVSIITLLMTFKLRWKNDNAFNTVS